MPEPVEQFKELISETRVGGHVVYFASRKRKWCLRLTMVYEDGQSIAFHDDDIRICFKKAAEFIRANRVRDDEDAARPWRIKTWQERRKM
jgi:hypothetical protein